MDRTELSRHTSVRDLLAAGYRQLCADEIAVSYLYRVIAIQERRPEVQELFRQMSVCADEAARIYAQGDASSDADEPQRRMCLARECRAVRSIEEGISDVMKRDERMSVSPCAGMRRRWNQDRYDAAA
jgi:hypothetical protein